jgi:hypothetical protein
MGFGAALELSVSEQSVLFLRVTGLVSLISRSIGEARIRFPGFLVSSISFVTPFLSLVLFRNRLTYASYLMDCMSYDFK